MKQNRTKILFVCRENACRSQMAEAFARYYGGEAVEIWSAGSLPRGSLDPGMISVMKEKGIDVSRHTSKGVDQLPSERWNVVVTMGCGDECPTIKTTHRLDWDIPDPKGKPPTEYRKVRDTIEDAVKALLVHLPELREG